jgi:ribosomal protein S18 acetylase RimI-like enzyme
MAGIKESKLIYREAKSAKDLMKLFRLRYEVYANSRVKGFLAENAEHIDFDIYDTRAWHFGIYDVINKPLGCIRVIDEALPFNNGMFEKLSCVSPFIKDALQKNKEVSFPRSCYSPDGDKVKKLYNHWVSSGEHVVEVSRLCILPNHRSIKIARMLAETTLAMGFFGRYKVDRAIFTCNSTHQRFYSELGFERISLARDYFSKDCGGMLSYMMSKPAYIKRSLLPRLSNIARSFDENGNVHDSETSLKNTNVCDSEKYFSNRSIRYEYQL